MKNSPRPFGVGHDVSGQLYNSLTKERENNGNHTRKTNGTKSIA